MPGQPSSAGIADLEFINQLRSDLRDPPVFYKEQISPDGASLVYRMQNQPHFDGDAYGAQPSLFSIVSTGSLQTLMASYDLLSGAGQVYVDADTGFMYWSVAPAAGTNTLVINHRKANWTNKAMRFALYSGLRAIFPKVFQVRADVTFPLSTLQWEYPLPAIFSDPRVRVMNVEVQEIPSTMERFREIQSWKRVGLQTLHIPVSQSFTPGSTVRVTYRGPVASLSDLDAQSQELPILYAKWVLLSNREAPRSRQDSITATQGVEGVNPPGTSMNAGLQYKQAFNQLLDAMPMVEPFVPTLSTYAR
jgi:hypothetical protein